MKIITHIRLSALILAASVSMHVPSRAATENWYPKIAWVAGGLVFAAVTAYFYKQAKKKSKRNQNRNNSTSKVVSEKPTLPYTRVPEALANKLTKAQYTNNGKEFTEAVTQALVENTVKPNDYFDDVPLLMWAVKYRDRDLVKLLLGLKANIEPHVTEKLIRQIKYEVRNAAPLIDAAHKQHFRHGNVFLLRCMNNIAQYPHNPHESSSATDLAKLLIEHGATYDIKFMKAVADSLIFPNAYDAFLGTLEQHQKLTPHSLKDFYVSALNATHSAPTKLMKNLIVNKISPVDVFPRDRYE